jgi:hypothetical protein
MNNNDTPETDFVLAEVKQHQIAFFTQECNFGGGTVTWENPIVTLCRRLERERDEARAALEYIAHAGLPARQLEDCARKALEEMK